MSQFGEFNAENKLRIPLSGYAAHIIENDCFNFSKKKTTLINTIILNSYQNADCSISLRIKDYRNELATYSKSNQRNEESDIVNRIIKEKANELKQKYAKRYPSDFNWQITLQKKVKELLTEDEYSAEEDYYGQKPGHYIRALLEEYARHPHYLREEIVFKNIIEQAEIAIDGHYILNVTNVKGKHFSIKPYGVKTDPFSMYHYLIGYNTDAMRLQSKDKQPSNSDVICLRISRLASAEAQYFSSGELTKSEIALISREIEIKGVQFITSDQSSIQVWLSDAGIKKFETRAHLRPPVAYKDSDDEHIYHFECTESQILFYFFGFGSDAKVISPPDLAICFKDMYKEAYDNYRK